MSDLASFRRSTAALAVLAIALCTGLGCKPKQSETRAAAPSPTSQPAHVLPVRRGQGQLGRRARDRPHAGAPRRVVRDLYPVNTHSSQSPARIHLGLGRADRVDLEIRWPSGRVSKSAGVRPGQHLVVDEGP